MYNGGAEQRWSRRGMKTRYNGSKALLFGVFALCTLWEVGMKYKIYIDGECEDEVIIYARERNALIDRIEELILSQQKDIIAYGNGGAVKLSEDEIFCFVVEEGRVLALTECDRLQLKMRLYQLEEKFSDRFVKINQSCLVNMDKIARFDASIGGALMVTLKNGYKDYISRRQVKAVKDRVGL